MSAAPDPSARQVLEPCPFCGSAHVDVVMFETHHNEMWHRAECQNCMAKSSGSKYPALAIAAWNRRHPDPAVAELVEVLKAGWLHQAAADATEIVRLETDIERLQEIVRGFLDCPEIADCAPEDKDPDTDDLERRARALLAKHAAKQEKDHG